MFHKISNNKLSSNPAITDNIISGNSVNISGSYTTPSGYGGGLFLRGSNAILTGNLISDNHVNAALNSNARGGGLYLYYGSPVFVNNTISGNSLENTSTNILVSNFTAQCSKKIPKKWLPAPVARHR